MVHPLEHKLASLRTRLRRLVTLYGLSWLVAVALGSLVLLGLADYAIRFDDRGLRVLASLAVVGAIGGAAYRFLYLPLHTRLRDVELARQVQRRFPSLGDELASAVEFLRQPEDDPKAGSVALRRAVITRAVAQAESLRFEEAIEQRPAVRAAMVAVSAVLVALVVLVASPTVSGIALARLANPFGNIPWPQKHYLAVREPVHRVARGQPFEIEVVDAYGAGLPESVRIFYRFDNPEGPPTEESEPMRFLDGAMVARRESVLLPFSYRVEGGDDRSMPWQPVDVVEPPAIESLSVRLIPPAYTGWPAETVEGNFHALVGTHLEFSGRASKPLKSATLVIDKDRQTPAIVAEDGLSFHVPASAGIAIAETGSYGFQLVDRENMPGGGDARWEVRAIPDEPPVVSVEQPRSNVFVTPQATLPIEVTARDDLAIERIELQFGSMPEREPDRATIYEGAAKPQATDGAQRIPENLSQSYDWNLEPLGLRPGMQLTFRVVAVDYRPQTGASEQRRVSVITPEELVERIAARQATLLAELVRVLEMQRQLRTQVAALQARAGAASLSQPDVDHLRGAELNQRRVSDALTDRRDGVPSHIVSLLADLENNKIESPAIQQRMQRLLAEVERLAGGELPTIRRELTAAIKAVDVQMSGEAGEASAGAGREAADRLAAAVENQDRVIASLEQMLDELGRWNSFRQFHRDLNQLLREQEELSRQTAEVGRRTLTQARRDLSPQDAADLDSRGREQLELARRLERLMLGMEQASGNLQEEDPLAAQTLTDALARARELDVAGRMRSVAGQVQDNRMGQAIAGQRGIEQSLSELLDLLSGKRANEVAGLVKKLRQAEAELDELAQREEQLRKQFEQAASQDAERARNELQRLAGQQKQLEDETDRKARQLQQLNAQQAADAARRGAAKMGEAGQSAAKSDGRTAAQRAEEARKALEQARQDLAEQRQKAEAQLADELRAKLETAIKSLVARQQKAMEETQRLDDLRRDQPLTPGQEASLVDLARQQRLLQTETSSLSEKHAEAQVFSLAVSLAAKEMAQAAGLLDRRQTGGDVQQAQQAAQDRLSQVLESLKPEPPAEKPPQENTGQGGSKRGPRNPGGVPELAQIKLLKMMQEDVNRRTQVLEKTLDGGGPAAEDARRKLAELSLEQGRLAELLIALIPPEEEDVPDDLPMDLEQEKEDVP